MQRLRTVLLEHAQTAETHYDWMFETPGGEQLSAGLTTFRVASPWTDWPRLRRIVLTPLPPHRRAYLHKQGAVSAGRGAVRRIGLGYVEPLDHHTGGGVLRLVPDDAAPAMRLRWRHLSRRSAEGWVLGVE